MPRHGIPDVLVPAGGVHRQPEPLEGVATGALTPDVVWAEIEAGAGATLPWRTWQFGDTRCNRTAYGALVGDGWVPLLDEAEPRDLEVREAFFRAFGGMDFDAPPALLAAKLARVLAAHPDVVPRALGWARRFSRPGGRLPARPRALTFVMHNFMDAEEVRPAWEALQRGEVATDPAVRGVQERLQACSYAMAHPESDTLVPACAQHSVLDPEENRRLVELLPMAGSGAQRAAAAAG